MKILIIEDDSFTSILLKAQINKNWPEAIVERVEGLQEAFRTIETFNPEIVTLDLHLLDGDIKDTVAAIPFLSHNAAVVVITGALDHDKDTIEVCRANGAVQALDKNTLTFSGMIDQLKEAGRICKLKRKFFAS